MSAIQITNGWLNLLRDSLAGAASPQITYVALGSGTNTPAVTDTALQTEVFRKAVTTYTNGATGEVQISLFLAPGDAIGQNIQEVGFFAGATASSSPGSGVLVARGLWAHTPKLSTESIVFTLDGLFGPGIGTPSGGGTGGGTGGGGGGGGIGSPASPLGVPGTWKLIFEDTFASGINTAIWDHKYSNGDTHSDELGQYVPNARSTANGVLELLALNQTAPDGRPYQTGMISSHPGFTFQYGFVESAIQFGGGNGMWPAFWMLSLVEWTNNGPELDIIENLNGDSVDHMHWHATDGHSDGFAYDNGTSLSAGYHTYGCLWQPGLIEWWVDGVRRASTNKAVTSDAMYIILLNAVSAPSGYAGRGPDASTPFPNVMKVKYVRVWQ